MFLERDFSRAEKVEKLLEEIKVNTWWLMPEVNAVEHSDKILATADKAIELLQELKSVLSE